MYNSACMICRNVAATLSPQDDVAACFEYYAGLAEKLDGRQWQPVELGEESFKSEIRREPLGAVRGFCRHRCFLQRVVRTG